MVLPKTGGKHLQVTVTLHKRPERRARAALPKTTARRARQRIVEQQLAGLEVIDGAAVVYQLERVRCGKETCRVCRRGYGHGPYWYAYWRAKKRTASIYIGKQLRSVREALDQKEGKKK